MQEYGSTPELLFQTEPEYGRKSTRFKPSGWTTLLGYWQEAKNLCLCIDRNRQLLQRPYTWEIGINVEHTLPPEEVKQLWVKVSRSLQRGGMVAFWVREPSPTNHVNYHLLLTSKHTERELCDLIDRSIPDGIKYHKHVDPVEYQWNYPRYILKAKVAGYVKVKAAGGVKKVYTPDKYAKKRLLFIPNKGLRKYGTIGKFWVKPHKQVWADVCEREKRIATGLEQPGVREQAEALYQLFQGDVPRRRIERSLGYFATMKPVPTMSGGDSVKPEPGVPAASQKSGSIIATWNPETVSSWSAVCWRRHVAEFLNGVPDAISAGRVPHPVRWNEHTMPCLLRPP